MSPDDARGNLPLSLTIAAGRTPAEELEAIIQRAAALGIPAWRVTTALGLALPVAA